MDASPEESTETINEDRQAKPDTVRRRSFLSRLSSVVMAFGITPGYGTFAWLLGRFLYPFRRESAAWQFLSTLESFQVGDSMTYEAPAGQKVVITRRSEKGTPEDFIALSSVCPHLGCQVHWQNSRDRFFCPCHNGAFDSSGKPIAGPPADANQELPEYPLQIKGDLLLIQVPTESLV